MARPKISIIIPVYNTGAPACKLAGQILAQGLKSFEIIFINDGSTDSSKATLQKLASAHHNIHLFSQKNAGPAAARNLGLKHATGEFISFLDSDDNLAPSFYSAMLTKLQKSDTDLVTCGILYHRISDHTSIKTFTAPALSRLKNEDAKSYVIRLLGEDGRLYSSVNKIYRRSIIEKHHLAFDAKLNFGEDLLFNLAYLTHAKHIAFIHEPLYIYNYGTPTSTVKNSALIYANWQQNWDFIEHWYQPHGAKATDQKNWVRYRWNYSYCLAVLRSSLDFRKKYALLRIAVKDKNLPRPGKKGNLGPKKSLLERAYKLSHTTTPLLYVYARALLFFHKRISASGAF